MRLYKIPAFLSSLILFSQLSIAAVPDTPQSRNNTPPYLNSGNAAFRNLTSADGLPTTSVTDVTQDAFGFIWIGSWDYVYKYDGNSFFKIPSSAGGRYLEADKNGGVWISFSGSAGYYDPFIDSILVYKIAKPIRYPNIKIDRTGTVWITSEDGILRFDKKSNKFIKENGQREGMVMGLRCRADGSLLFTFLGTNIKDNNWLIGRRDTNGRYSYEPFPRDPAAKRKRSYYYPLPLDSTGILLINEFGWTYKTDEDSNWVFNKRSKDKISLNYSSAKIDPNGYLWIVTNEALRKINIRSGEIVSFKPDPFNSNSILPLDANFFNESTIFLDRQGILWIPDFSQGISRLNLFESYFGLLKDSTGSPLPDVLSALESKDGSFWIGSAADNGGLFHYNPDKKMIKKYHSDSENSYTGRNSPPGRSVSTLLSHPYVFTIAESNDGSIWVGGGSPGPQMGGVNRIRPGTNQITRFKYDPDDSNSIPGDWVFRILVDGSDRVWVASNNYPDYYAGLCFIDPVSEKVTRGIKDPVTGLSDNNPYMPELITSQGDIIIGNMKLDTAYIIDHKTLEVKPFGMISPPEGQFYYSEQDNAGRFWFISNTGFGYLDSLHKDIAYFYDIRKNNVPADEISGLKSDKEGKIWLSSDNGIFQFDPASGKLKHFGFNRGLQGNNFNFRINYKGPSGKIYFGGNGGINIFDPEDINTNPNPPEMIFTGLKLDGKAIKFGKDSPIRKPIFAADKIIVNPDVMTISIDFSAIHFAGFKDNKYQYKLEGFDKNWIDGGTIGNATYTHIPPGEYTLYIKGSNCDGVWCNGNTSIAIVILPPWWQTWWANIIYALGFLGILGGIRKFELNRRQEKEDRRILELENKQKKEELEQARRLQLSMLPKDIPYIPNLDVAAYMKTATEVGGDYYDFNLAEDGTLTAILGDVTGHGLNAGMMVSISKGLFSRLGQETKFENIIDQFNNSLFSMKLQPMYMSGFFIRIQDDSFQIVGAGMPPVLFYQNQNGLVTEIESSGPPLGGFPDFVYKVYSHKLNSGDIVVIMSDGFAERRNISKQLFGWEKGKEILNQSDALSSQKIIEEFIKSNDKWGGAREQDDDITIIVIKAK